MPNASSSPLGFRIGYYGITNLRRPIHPAAARGASDVFRFVSEARERVLKDAIAAGMPRQGQGLHTVGSERTCLLGSRRGSISGILQ